MGRKHKHSKLDRHPVDVLNEIAERQELLKKYFRSDSRLWDAIWRNICYADPCVIDRKGRHVKVYSEGPGVHLKETKKETGTWEGNGYVPPTTFVMRVEVQYEDSFGEIETQQYSIYPPIDLEDDIEEEEFNGRFKAWVESEAGKREVQNRHKELTQLQALIKKHPDKARRYLED